MLVAVIAMSTAVWLWQKLRPAKRLQPSGTDWVMAASSGMLACSKSNKGCAGVRQSATGRTSCSSTFGQKPWNPPSALLITIKDSGAQCQSALFLDGLQCTRLAVHCIRTLRTSLPACLRSVLSGFREESWSALGNVADAVGARDAACAWRGNLAVWHEQAPLL